MSDEESREWRDALAFCKTRERFTAQRFQRVLRVGFCMRDRLLIELERKGVIVPLGRGRFEVATTSDKTHAGEQTSGAGQITDRNTVGSAYAAPSKTAVSARVGKLAQTRSTTPDGPANTLPGGWTIDPIPGFTMSHGLAAHDPNCPTGPHPTRDCRCEVFRNKAAALRYIDAQEGVNR